MSVIGPRPALWNQDVLIAEREKYNANDVKPGLTGWAQINGRDELEIPVKAKLDGEYVEKLGIWMDIKCFLACNYLSFVISGYIWKCLTEIKADYVFTFEVSPMLDALEGKEHHCEYQELDPVADEAGRYCYVPTTHKATLGEIVDLLEAFKNQPKTLLIPEIPEDSFAKKLYSTYLSYLPKEEASFPLKMNVDDRGSFTELLKTANCGQFSVNISKPGITKGEHWHNSKWEFFIVVSGHGLIQERKIGTDCRHYFRCEYGIFRTCPPLSCGLRIAERTYLCDRLSNGRSAA